MTEALKTLLASRVSQLVSRLLFSALSGTAGYNAAQADQTAAAVGAAVIAVVFLAIDIISHKIQRAQGK